MASIEKSEQTTPPSERRIDYHGRKLRVRDVSEDPYGNPIRGFKVSVPGVKYELVNAEAWEGMYLGDSEYDGEALIEDDILEVNHVANRTGEQGLGTLLTRFVLEEGKRRGFNRARLIIHNPKIIKIIEKLRAEEAPVVQGAVYFEDYAQLRGYPSTHRLRATTRTITAEQAMEYLHSFPAEDDGFVFHARVDCLVDI